MPLGQITSNAAAMAVAGVATVVPDGISIDVRAGAPAVATLLSHAGKSLPRRRAGNVFHHDSLLRAALHMAGDRAVAVAVTRQDALATVWPLRLEDRYGIRIATDLAAPFAQYSDVIGEPLDSNSLESLRARLRDELGVDVILCRGVRADSGLARALAMAASSSSRQRPISTLWRSERSSDIARASASRRRGREGSAAESSKQVTARSISA